MFQYVRWTTDWWLLVLELTALVWPPVNPTSTDTMTTATLLARIHLFISKYPLPYQRTCSFIRDARFAEGIAFPDPVTPF
jgi:hypothetical protein